MTSKKIIAFMLMICMLLTCIPAFAAQVEVPVDDVVFPEDGLGVTINRHLCISEEAGGNVKHILFILDSVSSNLFKFKTTISYYKGVTISFSAKQKAAPEGAPVEFTVVNVPVNYTRTTGDQTGLCLGALPKDIIAASPELSAYKAANPTLGDEDILSTATVEYPLQISNAVLNKGEWNPSANSTVDTGAFPAGTIFLNYEEFNAYPSTYPTETRSTTGYSYGNLIFRNNRTNSGCMQFFVPEVSGEYNVYVQLISNNGYLSDRAVKLSIDGKTLEYLPANYEAAGLLPSGMEPIWCYETAAKTVNLTEGEVVAVELLGNSYGRPASIAFVPTAANDELYKALTADPKVRQVAHTDIVRVAPKAYHPDFAKGEVTLTVNGKTVAVTAGHAAKKNSSGYAAPAKTTVYGVPVRVLPETNTFPTYLTALDAISKYIKDLGSSTPIMVTSINNGSISGYAVFVNDKLINDIDWYEVKEGDVITIQDKNKKNSFEPVPVKGFKAVDTSNEGFIYAIGTPTSGEGAFADGKLKICFDKALLTAALPFAGALDETGIKGCYLVGYLTMRKDNSNAFTSLNGGANWTDIDMNSKVYFENIPILGYDLNAAANSGSRVDIVTGGNVTFGDRYPYYKDPTDIRTNADGKYLIRPYQYFADPYLFKWQNVYIVNEATDLSIQVTKGRGNYTLKTGGCHVIDIIVATYSEDGKTVIGTDVKTEQILMFNNPIDIPLNANQKAFIWKSQVHEGTSMIPVMAPLSGADL